MDEAQWPLSRAQARTSRCSQGTRRRPGPVGGSASVFLGRGQELPSHRSEVLTCTWWAGPGPPPWRSRTIAPEGLFQDDRSLGVSCR